MHYRRLLRTRCEVHEGPPEVGGQSNRQWPPGTWLARDRGDGLSRGAQRAERWVLSLGEKGIEVLNKATTSRRLLSFEVTLDPLLAHSRQLLSFFIL
jgi:hypothetical protein